MGIGCEKCGKMIRAGRFCPECVNQMTNAFQSVSAPKQMSGTIAPPKKDSRDGNRMRFLNQQYRKANFLYGE